MPRRTNTRERLIETAVELFARQGYAHTGVNEIMQQARTTSGSFYHFFPTKEDLVLAVVEQIGESLDREIFTVDSGTSANVTDHIAAVASWYRRHLVEHDFALGSPLGTLAAELSESHPQVREKLADVFGAWTDHMQRLLENAGDGIPAGLDSRTLAEFIMSAIEGAVLQARVRRSIAPFDASISELQRHIAALGKRGTSTDSRAPQPRPAPRTRQETVDWRAW